MIEPAAPIIPGDKIRRLVPQPASDDHIHLFDRPTHAVGDVLPGVLAEIGPAVAIDPGYRRQPAGGRIMHKQIAGVIAAVTGELVYIMKCVAPVVTPRESGVLQLRRQ